MLIKKNVKEDVSRDSPIRAVRYYPNACTLQSALEDGFSPNSIHDVPCANTTVSRLFLLVLLWYGIA